MTTRLFAVTIGIAASAAILGCASGGRKVTHAGNPSCPVVTDSVLLSSGEVFRDCAVDVRAMAVKPPSVPYTPASETNQCLRAIVEIVVDEKGRTIPGTIRWIRQTTASYAEAVVAAAPNWQYFPAQKDGRAVKQVVRAELGFAMVRMSGAMSGVAPPRSASRC
jgi:hypothetical protein